MKAIGNSLLIALAMYSKIPVPKVKRTKENMKYTLCFFPLVGLAVGILIYAFSQFVQYFGLGQACFALIGTVLPLLVTGGLHLNGFQTVMDARHFPAVLSAGAYYMLYAGGLVLIWQKEQLLLLVSGYVLSHILGAMAAAWFPPAKKAESMFTFTSSKHKLMVRLVLTLLLVTVSLGCIAVSPIMGVLEILLCFWIWTYYYYMSRRVFGGITGDLQGYFISICELGIVLYLGIFGRIFL